MSTFTIIGRRWFEKVNGNTYHSTEVYRDGLLLDRVGFTYGYDRMYDQTAADIIAKHCPRIWGAAIKKARGNSRHYTSLPYGSSLANYSKHKVITSVTDVERKKDL